MTERRRVLAVVVLAFAFRMGFLLAYGIDAPLATWGDDPHYARIAETLVSEHRYDDLWFPPGYPLLVSAVYAIAGPSHAAVRVVQALLGAVTVWVTYLLGRRLFDGEVGLLAAATMSVLPSHVYMSWRMMAETTFCLLVTVAVYLLAEFSARGGGRRGVLLGLILGGMNIVKSNLVLFPPLALGWLAVTWKRRRQGGTGLLLAASGFVLVSMATPVANLIATRGDVGLVAGNAGHTLWWSNNPFSDGYFNALNTEEEGPIIEQLGMKEAFRNADRLEEDRLYAKLAVRWALRNPGTILKLTVHKLVNAFGPFPRAAVFANSELATWTHAVTWVLLAPFVLVGSIVCIRQGRECASIWLLLVSYGLMVMIYYGSPRFTVTVSPCLLVLAARGALGIRNHFRTRPA